MIHTSCVTISERANVCSWRNRRQLGHKMANSADINGIQADGMNIDCRGHERTAERIRNSWGIHRIQYHSIWSISSASSCVIFTLKILPILYRFEFTKINAWNRVELLHYSKIFRLSTRCWETQNNRLSTANEFSATRRVLIIFLVRFAQRTKTYASIERISIMCGKTNFITHAFTTPC